MNSITTHQITRDRNSRTKRAVGVSALSCAVLFGILTVSTAQSAFAAEAKVDLGASETYSVLAGQTVTNTGSSVLSNDLGVSPGTAITGFPPGLVLGSTHAADANASLAQSDLVKAYDDAASRAPTEVVSGDLVGRTLVGGVYKSDSSLDLNGTVTLDAQGDSSTVWIFQVGSALTTGSASNVALVNGASACNVYWQVGSSATLGTASSFKGSILALTSISVTTDATVEGRTLARNGAVTLDNNVFVNPVCAAAVPTVTPSATITPTATATPAPTGSATITPSPTGTVPPTGTTPAIPSPSLTATGTPTTTSPVDVAAPSDSSAGGAGSEMLLTDAEMNGTDAVELASDDELARTGAISIPLLTGLALTLGLVGAAFLLVTSRLNVASRRH